MSRIAFVNGEFVAHGHAMVSIDDRGYQFADGVYEVCEIRNGQIIDMEGHLNRLKFSLSELSIPMPMCEAALKIKLRQTAQKNRVQNGLVYFQISRGVAPRDHAFTQQLQPSIVITAKSVNIKQRLKSYENGVSVVTVKENRWDRVDIKTIGLLPNCMAKTEAKKAGAFEAWFVDDEGYVVEGSSSNAWIITKDNELITKDANGSILKGITREAILRQIKAKNLKVVERKFTLEEAYDAKEAFISSATTIVMPVTKINDQMVGNGNVGEIAQNLLADFYDYAEKSDI